MGSQLVMGSRLVSLQQLKGKQVRCQRLSRTLDGTVLYTNPIDMDGPYWKDRLEYAVAAVRAPEMPCGLSRHHCRRGFVLWREKLI